ncbi:hypothetical protein B7767_19760 [Streptomyces sp. 13-12-16]|uniref:hypothetical protein n=1 Tax=Streptomyces sp. 13-12-16 TaxID=1570823 RepID=UPI000A1F7630|nr:hypothetical protein [Streptomyces sp. 13-12-16]OSP41559.1 hypothetical protein B7767_19760 [Streptomyces sp. 13-12-16]
MEKQLKALPAKKRENLLDYINDPIHAKAFNATGAFRSERANGDVDRSSPDRFDALLLLSRSMTAGFTCQLTSATGPLPHATHSLQDLRL